jgi:DHA1 family bicyclomycin/chloramphenicol resistance-like MFS transporter
MIFWGIAAYGAAVLLWFMWRMPETLPAEKRQPLRPGRLVSAWGKVISDRYALGYTIASLLLSGGLFGFIGSVQQIVYDVFQSPHLLTLVFAGIASLMALGSFLNSRLVMRLGTRLLSHAALVAIIVISAVHLAVAWFEWETLASFILLQALMMGCFALSNANFSAMAMENMGQIAGTAASLQGFAVTLGGALIGAVIGQAFDGSTVPLYLGFLICGVLSLGAVMIAEHGRLFHRG